MASKKLKSLFVRSFKFKRSRGSKWEYGFAITEHSNGGDILQLIDSQGNIVDGETVNNMTDYEWPLAPITLYCSAMKLPEATNKDD